MFVGAVADNFNERIEQKIFHCEIADNFNERIEQKIFHCEIVVDAEKVKREEQAYKPIPVITDFTDADGNDRMKEMIQENYNRIRAEVRQIVADELQRIQSATPVAEQVGHRRRKEKIRSSVQTGLRIFLFLYLLFCFEQLV